MDIFEKALIFATKAHSGVTRKFSNKPFVRLASVQGLRRATSIFQIKSGKPFKQALFIKLD